MSERRGFSVRIFVPFGEPEGLRVVEKSGWTGQGLVFPRSRLADVRRREDLGRSGVYVLWGPGDSEQLPSVYVGEGDVDARLAQHAKAKDFWTHGVAFTSKDQSLNKAHIQYLEARLVELAAEAKRCELDNTSIPQKPALSEADRADAELYLTDMLLCLPIVGVRFFTKPPAPAETSPDLFLRMKGGQPARGYDGVGSFVVRAGSYAAKEEVAALRLSLSELRKTLVSKNILKETSSAYQFVQDYDFPSPSTAASVLLGWPANGCLEWKDAEGRALKDIREAVAETT